MGLLEWRGGRRERGLPAAKVVEGEEDEEEYDGEEDEDLLGIMDVGMGWGGWAADNEEKDGGEVEEATFGS